MTTWLAPDPVVEATGDSPARRAQRANRAAADVIRDYHSLDRDAARQVARQLLGLKKSLQARLAAENLTEFRQMTLTKLMADTDQLIADTMGRLVVDTETKLAQASLLADAAANEPLRAAQLSVAASLPGIDTALVQAAFGNTVDLLTLPMQQFAGQVRTAIRAVSLAGDNRMDAIQRLQTTIAGQGFDNAQYRAERIIRTEVGRLFNAATFERLRLLSAQFPFLGKGWRATSDGRTRRGHTEAGVTYGPGQGIPIADLFRVNVYDERGDVPKLIGVALLRFPIDPETKPEGRIAAGATIMCRCNAFVDINLEAFGEFTKSQVQLALGGPVPPAGGGPTMPPPVQPVVPRVRVTRPRAAPKPKAAPKPQPVAAAARPAGQPVSAHLDIAPKRKYDVVREAMKILDGVHGDGPLKTIPFKESQARSYYGALAYSGGGRGATALHLSQIGFRSHPRMTMFHEVGHWLDLMAVEKNATRPVGFFTTTSRGKPAGPLVEAWRAAVIDSKAIQTMKTWYAAPYDQRPKYLDSGHLRVLLSQEEMFARSYAQWVATRSGDVTALNELRIMQGESAIPVGPAGEPKYPTQWQDDDFEPIGRALDALFEGMGWRIPK